MLTKCHPLDLGTEGGEWSQFLKIILLTNCHCLASFCRETQEALSVTDAPDCRRFL